MLSESWLTYALEYCTVIRRTREPGMVSNAYNLILGRKKREDQNFRANLGSTARPVKKEKEKKMNCVERVSRVLRGAFIFSQACLKMSYFGQETYNQNQSEGDLDEESLVLTLVPYTKETTTEYPTESNVSSTIDHKAPVRSQVRYEGIKYPTRTILGTCPPHPLPRINEVSRNTLREWCRYHNLSTDGKKVEVYLRLWRHSYSKQECYIPNTSLEAKMCPKKPKIVFRGIGPPSSCQSEKQENGVLEILTSAQGSTFAAWGRVALRAAQSMSVNRCPLPSSVEAFLPETIGVRWCVVHGRQRPADRKV